MMNYRDMCEIPNYTNRGYNLGELEAYGLNSKVMKDKYNLIANYDDGDAENGPKTPTGVIVHGSQEDFEQFFKDYPQLDNHDEDNY